jgi:hypothetical protein
MGVARLTDLPAEWSRQREMLGFPAHERQHQSTPGDDCFHIGTTNAAADQFLAFEAQPRSCFNY